jgi:hypothetical protein
MSRFIAKFLLRVEANVEALEQYAPREGARCWAAQQNLQKTAVVAGNAAHEIEISRPRGADPTQSPSPCQPSSCDA